MSFTQDPSLQWLTFPVETGTVLDVRSAMNHTFSEPRDYIPLVAILATTSLLNALPE